MTNVKQDVRHGGTNNDTFTEGQLTYYDDENEKITSVDGTAVLVDEDNNPLLHVDKLDADDLHSDTADFDALEVNGDTVLNGNLTVRGTHTEEHSQDLFVGSDTITLRDGASTSLDTDEYAGILINKYDGTDSLGLVTTRNGTLKVGELNLVYVYTTTDDESDKYGKYYSDSDLTIEVVIPAGKTVFIESEDTVKKLAKGYYIAKDDTEVIATRDDSSEITDGAILYFDGTVYKLVDSGVTTEQLNALVEKLSSLIGDDKISVVPVLDGNDEVIGTQIKLADNNKIYTYSSVSAAEADLANIPNGATVHIIGDVSSASLDVVDTVTEGDYNIPTSDAVFNYLNNWSENIPGDFLLSGWFMKYGE